MLAARFEFDLRRAVGGQLHQFVVEEGHPRLQSPGHGHVVHPFHRVIHDQGGHVQAQHCVDAGLGPRLGEAPACPLAGMVGAAKRGRDHVEKLFMVTVEIVAPQAVGAVPFLVGQDARIPEIAAEDFVGALPRLDHLDLLRNLLAEQIEGHGVLPEHGFGHVVHRLGQAAEHFVVGNQEFVVQGLITLHHQVGVFKFVALLFGLIFETDGEGVEILLAQLGEQGHQQAGVEPAGEQNAHRHVGDLVAPPNRPAQQLVGGFDPLLFAVGALQAFGGELPVAAAGAMAVAVDAHPMGRAQLAHPAQDGARRRHHAVEGELEMDGFGIEAGVHPTGGEQGLGIGGEAEAPLVAGPVAGLDAKAVPGQKEAAIAHVPDRQGEHAVEMGRRLFAPFTVGLEDHFGVAVGKEVIPLLLELGAQLGIVVDGAVEDQRQSQFLVHHRLVGALGEVDHRQAPVPEAQGTVAVAAAVVGTAGAQLFGHGGHCRQIGGPAVESQFSANAAHGRSSSAR